MDDKLHEECGVFGVWSPNNPEETHNCINNRAADCIYKGLLALQHRGQESAGIAVGNAESLNVEKGMGLISQVFSMESLNSMSGHLGIGHVRYSTTGKSNIENAQPLREISKVGHLAVAHNGTLLNNEVLRSLLEDSGIGFHTEADSEIILAMLTRQLNRGLENALSDTMDAIKGSYAMVLIIGGTMVGVRDHFGIRPLVLGNSGNTWYLASESCALEAVQAETIRDVEPGEIILIDENGLKCIKQDKESHRHTCVFEYIYFARPDSRIDGISVIQSRLNMGRELAREWQVDADLVCGVPDSGIPAAMGYARESGIPFGMAFTKNHYVGRTFINPDPDLRERAISVKLAAVREEVESKRIVIIDDSIVRGTTSRNLIILLRNAGASQVHFGVVSPPITNPCYFGIDTPTSGELIANSKSVDDIRQILNTDSLVYLSLDGLNRALEGGDNFCLGCLTGRYPIPPHKLRI